MRMVVKDDDEEMNEHSISEYPEFGDTQIIVNGEVLYDNADDSEIDGWEYIKVYS